MPRPVGEVLGVRAPRAVEHCSILAEPLGREVADGLEHRQTWTGATGVDLTDETLVHERAESVEYGDRVQVFHAAGNGLDGLEGGA
jgi:hypothetical protein